MTPVRLREATLGDLDDLLRLEASGEFGGDAFSRSQFQYLLTRANATTLVLAFNGTLCGYATMNWRRASRTGRLYSIVVDPANQGRGFGARLLNACEEAARKRSCNCVSLEVRAGNKPAITLYERHGYRIVDTLQGYYADGSNGLKMTKQLTDQR